MYTKKFNFHINKKTEFTLNDSKFALCARKETASHPIMKQIPPQAATQSPDGFI